MNRRCIWIGEINNYYSYSIRRPLFHRENSLHYSLNLSMSGPHSRSGHCGAEKDVLPL